MREYNVFYSGEDMGGYGRLVRFFLAFRPENEQNKDDDFGHFGHCARLSASNIS